MYLYRRCKSQFDDPHFDEIEILNYICLENLKTHKNHTGNVNHNSFSLQKF